MRIIGVVPGAKLFGSEDLYADQYLFVNGYPKRISVCGGTPIGILSSDVRWSCAMRSCSAAARGFIRIILRLWTMRRGPASLCSASASGCR